MKNIILEKSYNLIFWYKSNSRFYELINQLHIQFIIENPEVFYLTKEIIENTYKAFNEPIGTEGKAREILLSKVFKIGWIRIRYNPQKQNRWFIEVDSFVNRRTKIKNLLEFLIYEEKLLSHFHQIEIWDQHGLQLSGKLIIVLSNLQERK